MKHRYHYKSKKGIVVHYEGVYQNVWFQCLFTENGLQLLFDGFAPDTTYSPEGYVSYIKFEDKVDLYAFVIEAFEHHYDRVSKNDFDSIEIMNEYFTKQKESKNIQHNE